MLSPFLVSPLKTPYPILPPPASMRVFPHPPTHSCLTTLASPFDGATSLHRTKHLPSHGYQIIQSSATYLSRAMDAPMYKLWVVVSSVRALRGQVSGY